MRPAGYHLTSVLLHALNAALVYFVARRLLRAAVPDAAGDPLALRAGSAVAALLFAVHPLRVESVAWVTERRDVLCGTFVLATVLAYLVAHDARADAVAARRWRRRAVVLFVLALLSKSMAVSLPVVLLLLDVYPLRRVTLGRGATFGPRAREAWREKLPFVALAAAASVVAVIALRAGGSATAFAALGAMDRAVLSVHSIAFYLWTTLAPTALSPLYELPLRIDPREARYLVSAAVTLGVTAAVLALRRRWPALPVAWASYLVMLLPVSGIVQNGPHMAADRYTYLPCVGWAILAGAVVRRAWPRAWPRAAALSLTAGALAVLVTLTERQIVVWHDSETLWTQDGPERHRARQDRCAARRDGYARRRHRSFPPGACHPS
jgi:hypothetical protein